MNIVLVSRNKAKLDKVADEVRDDHRVETMVIEADFTDTDVVKTVVEKIEQASIDVGVLVNNVGVIQSQPAYFNEVDEQTIVNMVQVRLGWWQHL